MNPGKFLWKPFVHRIVTGQWERLRLQPETPNYPLNLKQAGLYLHVPFCNNLCPYCPYNRQKYENDAYSRYEKAICKEIDLYAPYLEGTKFHSLYIGGGTPTVDVNGLVRILRHLKVTLDLNCDICIELHPKSMSDRCLDELLNVGVNMLSIGVESTSDSILKRIGRNHSGSVALDSLRRASIAGFDSINTDLMFALPGQTLDDWERDIHAVIEAGTDQISTYPLFAFPYSELGHSKQIESVIRPEGKVVRQLLQMTDQIAQESGFDRCAVWSWIKPKMKKFSSVTRHHYIGFGPSAASMTGTDFYVNTFDVDAYADSLPDKRPIALSMPINKRLEMAYWLYWRAYELRINNDDFKQLFGEDENLDDYFSALFRPLRAIRMMEKLGDGYQINTSGAYWIHRLQNEYSLSYINRLWGRCRKEAWPEQVIL